MSRLFTKLKIRDIEFKNRIFVSPMCQYSSEVGTPNDWHLVHLGSRAVGGAALVMAEATSVSPEGRISPDDNGIWNEEHTAAFKRITDFTKNHQAVPGIQLAHAGRKASTYAPWKGTGEVKLSDGGWQTIAPSPIPFTDDFPLPREMNEKDIRMVIAQFKSAAERSIKAGFEVIEIHMAHGYLVHQFLSPISNHREDKYGGSLENRCRFALEIAQELRNTIPETMPLFVRISVTDWAEGGWDLEQSLYLVSQLNNTGVDLIDCSSGGMVPGASIPVGPGYQLQFSEKIKEKTGILTGGVGLITSPEQAEQILISAQADVVFLGRELLRDPYWPLNAAKKLKTDIEWPKQYLRAK